MLRVCSDTCFINYHRVKNFPVFTCDICTSVFINKPLVLKREDGGKTICSEECLVKVKEVWLLHSKNAISDLEMRAGIEKCFDIKLHIMHFPVFLYDFTEH